MPGGRDFDVAVVGRGLIGSAAARHLAESGRTVVAIGPDEPADWTAWDGPFSSHGDEGRITRIGDADPVWSGLAARSIERYGDLEDRSGIVFHRPCGLLASTLDDAAWIATARASGAWVASVDPEWVRNKLGVTLPVGSTATFEGPPAGLINPRRLVEAQNVLARRAGASIIGQVVESVRLGVGPDRGVEIGGPWGSVRARRLVVATGAFGHHLLEPVLDGRTLPLVRRPRTVLLAEFERAPDGHPGDGALPSLIVRQPADDRLESIYWVPPVQYPDGRTCLKIGGSLASNPTIGDGPTGEAELIDWFHGPGDAVEAEALRSSLEALLPDRTIRSASTVPCVYTGTETGYPLIDRLDGDGSGGGDARVTIAIGGNGSAAKSSDELGRLAAALTAQEDGGPEIGPPPDPTIFGVPGRAG